MKLARVTLIASAFAAVAAVTLIYSQQRPHGTPANAQSIGTLNADLKSHKITFDQYRARVAQISAGKGVHTAAPARFSATARMKKVVVNDPALGIPAFSVKIPEDWTFEGTVLSGFTCLDSPKFAYRATSPDGLAAFQKVPRLDWSWSDNPAMRQAQRPEQCNVMPPAPAADVLTRVIVKQVRPDAQVVGAAVPIPGIDEQVAASTRESNAQAAAAAAQYGMPPTRISGDTARVRLQYSLAGHPEEEWLMVIRNTQDSPSPGMGGTSMHMYSSYASITAARAPAGQLDAADKLMLSIASSETAEPGWGRQVAENQTRQSQEIVRDSKIKIAGMQQQLADWSRQSSRDAQDQIRATGQASIQRARAQDDRNSVAAQRTEDYSLDQQEYINPDSGQRMKLSNQYNHAWVDQGGRVYYSDAANDNPNGQLSGNWTEVQQTNPAPH